MKLKVTAGVQSGALQAQTSVEIPDSVLARVQGLVSRGVSAVEIDEDGNLIFTLTDGSRANLGSVVGQDGRDGATIKEVWIAGLTSATPVAVVDVVLPTNDTASRDTILAAWLAGPGANGTVQGAGTLTFYADTAPDVNIPIVVGVVG